MSETDAVRPTSETGARCPVCQSETVCYRDAHGWTISCRLRFTDAEASGIPIHTFQVYGETEDEVRKKIPILNAARPRPDFPAGAPGLRPELARFALDMERQLRANDHKSGWGNDHEDALLARLREETEELAEAIRSDDAGWEMIIKEAADVANFAMMIADKSQPPLPYNRFSHAPAQPAAAGLTEIPGYEDPTIHAICAEIEYMTISNANSEDIVRHVIRRALGDRRFLIALGTDDILSSRATGAEVEIPEPSAYDLQVMRDSAGDMPDGNYGWHQGFMDCLAFARRHATTRGGRE